jgi:hypothetical protein
VRHAALSHDEYKALGYAKLLAELRRMLAQADRQMKWFDAQARQRILVALMAMRELTQARGGRTSTSIPTSRPIKRFCCFWDSILIGYGSGSSEPRRRRIFAISRRCGHSGYAEKLPSRTRTSGMP